MKAGNLRVLTIRAMLLLLFGTCGLASVNRVPSDYITIQAAIDASVDGDTILVAPGYYTGEGNRDIDFKGKAITVTSEEGPQTCIIDCQGTEDEQHRGFYFHTSEDVNSILHGFTITNGFVKHYGGGIKCDDSGPVIANCILTNNDSTGYGGAICCYGFGPTITNCEFIENTTRLEGGGIWGPANIINSKFTRNIASSGGAIFGATNINNCTIIDNSAKYDGGGGGVYNCENINSCVISANSGGGICNMSTTSNIINCKITGNSGSAIISIGGNIRNCTISGNFTNYNGGAIRDYGNITISNCILWDNEATEGNEIYARTQQLTISNSVIKGGYSGIHIPYTDNGTLNWLDGNFDANPCFVNPGYWADSNDPHIIIEPSNPNAIWIEGDYHLLSTSPCINAGDPCYSSRAEETDMDGEPRIINGRIDIGVDEVNCEGSVIGVWPRQLRFSTIEDGSNPENKVLSICNTGVDMVNWSISYDCNWLYLYPDKGNSAGEVNKVTLDVDISGLSAGYYNCELTIHDPNAFNSPQTAIAHLSVGNIYHVPDEFSTIQDAINACNNSDVVLVAPGIYTGDGNCDIDFKGKAITVKSEDGPNNCIIDCNTPRNKWPRGFYFHSGEDSNSVLSDFTIINATGGCIVCEESSPMIINCRIGTSDPCSVGYLRTNGPGIVCSNYSNPTIIDCSIIGNITWDGAGIVCYDSNPNINNCLISGNMACGAPKIILYPGAGGGIYCIQSNPTITNSIIVNNRADYGGGIYCENSNPIIKNCLISGNGDLVRRTDGRNFEEGGGGIYCNTSSPTITDCTLTGNVNIDGKGGAIYSFNCSNPIIDNCILWGNIAKFGNQIALDDLTDIKISSSTATITYSNVQGGQKEVSIDPNCTLEWGIGNIDVDPLFVESGYWAHVEDVNVVVELNDPNALWIEGDYHLKSEYGRWDSVSESWVVDDVTSPCIDAGDPNSPVGDEPEPNGGRINMGAYGGTAEASKSGALW
ncbi:MAG: right-handed parallel beta-helix repeat-containing protein [Planctomycetota bacterium]|jgi:hypothetical protein